MSPDQQVFSTIWSRLNLWSSYLTFFPLFLNWSSSTLVHKPTLQLFLGGLGDHVIEGRHGLRTGSRILGQFEFKGVNLFFELLDENNNNLEQKHGKWRLPPVVGTYSNNLLRKRKPRGQKRVGRKQKSCEKEGGAVEVAQLKGKLLALVFLFQKWPLLSFLLWKLLLEKLIFCLFLVYDERVNSTRPKA